MSAFTKFNEDLLSLSKYKKQELTDTLSNIFTMRVIGNKTHGDLAEVAITEFINEHMKGYNCVHVGKELFRSKGHEEDVIVTNTENYDEFPISLKAYGDGPLQLSTDKECLMFPLLESYGSEITDPEEVQDVFDHEAFSHFGEMNVLPLIYKENKLECNILVFNARKAELNTRYIRLLESGSGRKHPVYRFYDRYGDYIMEVRYGGRTANALQRGLWTHTKNAHQYFRSATDGWIKYKINNTLVQLFARALISNPDQLDKVLGDLL